MGRPHPPSAPAYPIPQKEVVAVEHPMVVKNTDKALATFGRIQDYRRLLDVNDYESILPLYLHPKDPYAAPIHSQNSMSNNVLLKITVPKRTGRKRKRGSNDPFTDHGRPARAGDALPGNLQSHSRLDNPARILRSLKDNKSTYKLEAVAAIEQTHRFRCFTDLHTSTANAPFASKVAKHLFPAELDGMRKFQFEPEMGWKAGAEIQPPPMWTTLGIPFNWGYHQNTLNSVVRNQETGELSLINSSKPPLQETDYLPTDVATIPTKSKFDLPAEPLLRSLVLYVKTLMEERPIWTRRALSNRAAEHPSHYLLKFAIQHIGYQFKSGPFRDAIIKFGLDPRTDPKWRIYQTLFFKLYERDRREGTSWRDVKSTYTKHIVYGSAPLEPTQSHIFNGTSMVMDGKVWQLCDITDPFTRHVIDSVALRDKYESKNDGYYANGSWAKIKAIMRTKLMAIRVGKVLTDTAFEDALHAPDVIEGKESNAIHVLVPDMRLTEAEVRELEKSGLITGMYGRGIQKKGKKQMIRDDRAKYAAKRGNVIRAAARATTRRKTALAETLGSQGASSSKAANGQAIEQEGPGLVIDHTVPPYDQQEDVDPLMLDFEEGDMDMEDVLMGFDDFFDDSEGEMDDYNMDEDETRREGGDGEEEENQLEEEEGFDGEDERPSYGAPYGGYGGY